MTKPRHWAHARSAVFATLCGLAVAGCGDPKEITVLKTSKLDLCPGHALSALVDGYMQRVRWAAAKGVHDDGAKQVDVIGLITVDGKKVTAKLEFLVDVDANSYRFGALKIDGKGQEDTAAAELLSAMCAAAGGPKAPEPTTTGS